MKTPSQPANIKVRSYYDNNVAHLSEKVCHRFKWLMFEYDNNINFMSAFYTKQLLDEKLSEAKEVQYK